MLQLFKRERLKISRIVFAEARHISRNHLVIASAHPPAAHPPAVIASAHPPAVIASAHPPAVIASAHPPAVIASTHPPDVHPPDVYHHHTEPRFIPKHSKILKLDDKYKLNAVTLVQNKLLTSFDALNHMYFSTNNRLPTRQQELAKCSRFRTSFTP